MDWQDEGTILSVRPQGETSALIEALTAAHGRHAGVVRGGISRRIAPVLQPGGRVRLAWRARLEDHLGTFTVEPLRARAAILSDRRALLGLNAATALLRFALPEREPHPRLAALSEGLFDALAAGEDWPALYLLWELALLEELGYGLDLSSCAVTGRSDDLRFVSPRSGRAVSGQGAGNWAPRLLPLPPGLRRARPGPEELQPDDLLPGLRLTGHFLAERLTHDRPLPEARQRLLDALGRDIAAGRAPGARREEGPGSSGPGGSDRGGPDRGGPDRGGQGAGRSSSTS